MDNIPNTSDDTNVVLPLFEALNVTIDTETRLSIQNYISQEEVFNASSSCFHVLLGGFH